jgi:ABC-type transport system substrate-binding protein/tRNA A-37 threonylcarbamoyl transferase component Bud32
MSNLIGQSLGRYHILEQLGEGGMATVYKAYDTRLERDVAIKIIRRGAFPPDQLEHMLKRFEREAKSLAKLSHLNIVKVMDYGEHEDSPYLVMEYLPGGTLKQRLGKPIPWQDAVRLLLPIAQALEYAHEHNIIHRDIKPANILLTEKGQPMLTDFGIAKILETDDTATLTGTGVGVGTPEYMAPEQWTGQTTPQSDIYSLGVVLYEMITGRKPYMADTPAAILLKQATDPLPRPTQFVPDLPDAVEKMLIKALAKKFQDRYQTIAEFVHALETLLSGVSSVIKPQPSQPERPRERKTVTQATINQMEDATVEDSPASHSYEPSTPSAKQPSTSSGILRYWPLAVGGILVICILSIILIVQLVTKASPTTVLSTAVPSTAVPSIAVPSTALLPTAIFPTEIPFVGDKVSATNCTYGGEFKAIEAVDQYTVKFSLCTPDPAFLSKVAFGVFAIQDKDYLTANGGDSAKMSEHPNGTGPYMVKEWVRGDHITFVANPNYWGSEPKNKTLIFRWSADAAQRLLELQSGTVDGIFAPSAEDYATIQADPNLKFVPYQTGNVFYIGLNNTKPPFDNEAVRQAFAMAIDKKRIVDNFYPKGSTVAEQFIPESFSPGFSTTGDGATWYRYNAAAAKKMLEDANFNFNQTITLSYRDVNRIYLPHVNQVAQDIQAQLAEIGVKVTLNKMESGSFIESVYKGEQAMFLLGWGMDYPDSTNFYDFHFASNPVGFGNEFPDLVAEIKAAAQISDPIERQKHYDIVNTLIKQHVPVIPVAHGATADAFKASVGNVVIGPLNENFREMTTDSGQVVWMQGAEPISLWCGDESDGDTLRACLQVYDSLLAHEFGGTKVVPALAESWDSNADATEWTFHLRQGVTFHNGATFDANDVVASYAAQWDYTNPNHKGNSGAFEYLKAFFGQFLNAP